MSPPAYNVKDWSLQALQGYVMMLSDRSVDSLSEGEREKLRQANLEIGNRLRSDVASEPSISGSHKDG